jgi:hypothetical protein
VIGWSRVIGKPNFHHGGAEARRRGGAEKTLERRLSSLPGPMEIGCYISAGATEMTDFDDKKPDGPLTPKQEAQARLLTAAQLRRIDDCLLSHMSHQWRKVAYVIGQTMKEIYDEFPGIPDVFYGLRIKHLAESGAIEAAGNLGRMRFSEIRLPEPEIKHRQTKGQWFSTLSAVRRIANL